MAKYMLLIHQDEKRWADVPQAEMADVHTEYLAVTKAMGDAGVLLDGDPLEPGATGRLVAQDGAVTDGPYAETAEHLGGYYLLDVAGEAAAVEWARRLPGVQRGLDRIEVRAIRPIPGL